MSDHYCDPPSPYEERRDESQSWSRAYTPPVGGIVAHPPWTCRECGALWTVITPEYKLPFWGEPTHDYTTKEATR